MSNTNQLEALKFFLTQFPNNATCWSQATDEVRDLARGAREYLEEQDEVIIEPFNFRGVRNPSEWNTEGKKYIFNAIDQMSDICKERYLEYANECFVNTDEEE